MDYNISTTETSPVEAGDKAASEPTGRGLKGCFSSVLKETTQWQPQQERLQGEPNKNLQSTFCPVTTSNDRVRALPNNGSTKVEEGDFNNKDRSMTKDATNQFSTESLAPRQSFHPSTDALAMVRLQRAQHMHDWMLYRGGQECFELREEVDRLQKKNQELKIKKAVLAERLRKKDEQMGYEIRLIKASLNHQQKRGSFLSDGEVTTSEKSREGTTADVQSSSTCRLSENVESSSSTEDTCSDDMDYKIQIPWATGMGSVQSEINAAGSKESEITCSNTEEPVRETQCEEKSKEVARSSSNDSVSDESGTLPFNSAEDCATVVGKIVVDSYGDGGVYSGDILVSTCMPHGFGKMIYEHMEPEHRVYEGEWHHGRWHGFGAIKFENGDRYIGACFRGQRHGRGRYKWRTGKVYVGDFSNDKRHGYGRLEYPNGRLSEGIFKHGQLVGPLEGE